MAQSIPPATEARITAVEAAAKSAQSAGDNAWMLVSAALVLMMTGPGLALFYGGLVRTKNVLSTMMHSFSLMAVVTVLWAPPPHQGGQALVPGCRPALYLEVEPSPRKQRRASSMPAHSCRTKGPL